MRLLDYLVGGLALLALPFLMWWGIYQSPQSAVNLQARLEARANAALAEGGAGWASVQMDGQRAILTGAAPSHDAVTEAARLVRQSSGAGGVIFGGVTLVESRTDAAPPVSPYVWRATKTSEGRIVLSGLVPSKAIQARLVEDARLEGRAAVDDEMILAAGAPAGNFQGAARLALKQLARMDEGEAILTDHRLVLRGDVADAALRAEIASAVSSVAAPFRGKPVLAGDIRWRARLEGNVLTLAGDIASEAERRQLLAAAARSFAGEIADEMAVGAGLPAGWIDGALAALPEFAKFSAGEMAFDAAGGVFLFEGEARPSTLYYLEDDMARGAGRWKAVIGAETLGASPEESGNLQPMSAGSPETDCAGELQAVLASGTIEFTKAGAAIARESGPLLDQIAGVIARCGPAERFEVIGPGSVQASEVVDFLVSAGVPRARLAAISYSRPAGETANQDADTETAAARPVDIRIMERSGE